MAQERGHRGRDLEEPWVFRVAASLQQRNGGVAQGQEIPAGFIEPPHMELTLQASGATDTPVSPEMLKNSVTKQARQSRSVPRRLLSKNVGFLLIYVGLLTF